MKTRALVGFTFVDAMAWLATECRARGCAMAVAGDGKRAWLGSDLFLIEQDEAAARAGAARIPGVDLSEIITRQSLEVDA